MKIDLERDTLLFESTGRREYIFGDGLSPNGAGSVCYGSDGGIGKLSAAEAREAAAFMIGKWEEWLRETIADCEGIGGGDERRRQCHVTVG